MDENVNVNENTVNVDVNNVDEITTEPLDDSTNTPEGAQTAQTEESNQKAVAVHLSGDQHHQLYCALSTTGIEQDAELISIAFIDNDEHSFYAEFNDFSFAKCSREVIQTVLPTLIKPETKTGDDEDNWTISGDRKTVVETLRKWFKCPYMKDRYPYQLVCDMPVYFWPQLCGLFNDDNLVAMIGYISPDCININQELADFIICKQIPLEDGQDELTPDQYEAANKDFLPLYECAHANRADFLENVYGQDSLADISYTGSLREAEIVRRIHRFIWNWDNEKK